MSLANKQGLKQKRCTNYHIHSGKSGVHRIALSMHESVISRSGALAATAVVS